MLNLEKRTGRDKQIDYLLFAVVVGAFILRIAGINFGLPYIYNVDEGSFVQPAYKILATGDLNPHWFGHPGSFLMYLLALVGGFVLGLQYLFGYISGDVSTFYDFVEQTRNDYMLTPATFHLVGRLIIVLMSILTIILVYKTAERLFNRHVGLLAAAILAFSPLHVMHSHYFRTDISSSLFILLSVYFLIKFLEVPDRRRYLWLAAFMGGIAVANKYTSGVIVVPVLTGAIYSDIKEKGIKKTLYNTLLLKNNTAMASLLMFFGFFLFAPFVILDFKSAIKSMKFETRTYGLGSTGHPGFQNYLWYIKNTLNTGIGGVFIELLACIGVLRIIKRIDLKRIILFLFPIIYFLCIGLHFLRWDRWMLVVFPFQAILAAIAAVWLLKLIKRAHTNLLIKIIGVVLIAGLVINLFSAVYKSIEICRVFMEPDSRTISKEWIETNIPSGSSIVYEIYCPPLDVNNTQNYRLLNMGWNRVVSMPLEFYIDRGYKYLVINGNLKERYLTEYERYSIQLKNYEEIENKCTLIKKISGANNRGKDILIYEIAL